MKDRILIDIGSSSVKVYSFKSGKLKLENVKSIPFKKNFDPEIGISKENKKALFALVKKVGKQNLPIKIYATAIFRKYTKDTLKKFANEFSKETHIKFNVISQEQENKYLELALVGKYKGKEKVLLINIGGGSTELVVMKGTKVLETHNLNLGVGTILSEFEDINKGKSKTMLAEIKKSVNKSLPVLKNRVSIAFYSGGELNYMKLAKYSLSSNNLFEDSDHPLLIHAASFAKNNKDLFEKKTLRDLEKLMPENPTWMHGARACSAFAQAICEKYGIKVVIPSDSNLIDGVARSESGLG